MKKVLALLDGKKSYLGFLLVWLAFALGPLPSDPLLAQYHIADVMPTTLVQLFNWLGAPLGGFGLLHKMTKLGPAA